METRRWTNPSQPQTLQVAVLLLYINAFFVAISGGLGSFIGLMMIVAYVAAGFGIANEQKWGYWVGVGVAAFAVLLRLSLGFGVGTMLSLLFDIALVALLIHPQSRDYQRIWFH